MLVRMKVQLIHQKSIWGSRTWLCMAPVRHLVSLGEASKEHQLWDIVGFMLTRVWSPQDLQGGVDTEEKDEYNHSDGFLMHHYLLRDCFLDYYGKISAEKSTDGLIP